MSGGAAFTHRVVAQKIPRGGVEMEIAATEGQRSGIAEELDLPSVERLVAIFEIMPLRGAQYRVRGELRADVHQICGVTLEAFPVAIVEAVDACFAPEEVIEAPTTAEVIRSLDDEDPPEPLENGEIDLARLAVETLAVALDPYPRKPGVSYHSADADDVRESPFAALAALRKSPPSDGEPRG
jgi:uncharacterized metal-binding protein YceD (DUF177 family)